MRMHRQGFISLLKSTLTGFMFLAAGAVQAQSFTLQNNAFSVTAGSGTSATTQSQTISEAGLVGTFTDLPSTDGLGIPGFDFTLVPNAVADGDYHFRVGITIDDDVNLRRLEAKIENLVLSVNGSTVTGSIPTASNPNGLYLLGRDSDNVYQLLIKVGNDQASGPVTISGGKLSFNAATLIDRIKAATNSSFETNILNGFNQTASYTYRIAIQQTSTTATGNPTLQFGTTQPSFVALPQVVSGSATGNDVQSSTAFELSSGELSVDFPSAYSVTGRFKVNIFDISADASNLTSEVANISLPSSGEVPAETKTALYAAMTKAITLLTNTEKELKAGNLQTDAALSAITAANAALEKITSANIPSTGIGVTPATTSIGTIANIAKVIAALPPASGTLTTNQKTQISTLATATAKHVTSVLKEGLTRSRVNGLVAVTSQVVQETLNATGEMTQGFSDQLKALGNQAGTVYTAALPGGITKDGDLSSLAGIKALADTPPTVKNTLLEASPVIAGGNTENTEKTSSTVTTTGASGGNGKGLGVGGLGAATIAAGVLATAVLVSVAASDNAAALEIGGNLLNATAVMTAELLPNSTFINLTAGDEIFAGQLGTVRVASDLLSEGESTLPNGQKVAVKDSIAIELGGAPANNTVFTLAIEGAGYTLDYVVGGNFSIGLPNNERFSGTFPLQNVAASTECSSVSFTPASGAMNAASYAFEMSCDNGVTQKILPVVLDPAFYTTVADAGIEVSTDKTTGIITIPGVGSFKPSFFVTPHTAADTVEFNASKNSENIGFRASDKNGDGKVDYEILSIDGVQVLYAL